MSVFYVLPPRAALGEALARYLRPYFPGMKIAADTCAGLIDGLTETQSAHVLHREDVPGSDVLAALQDGFGAERGDLVIQVSLGPRTGAPDVRVQRIGEESDAESVGSL
jgi:hypothetical protein